MVDLLGELEAELTRRAPALVQALRPGLVPQQTDALMRVVPQPIPEDLRHLYLWHDGTEIVHGAYRAELFTYGTMSPLERAVELWEAVVANTDGDWNPRWFPVFGEERGLFHAVTCGPGGGALVLISYMDLPTFHLEYSTLREFFESLVRRWRSGIYQYSDLGEINTDYQALAAIRRDEDGTEPDVPALVGRLAHADGDEWSDSLFQLRSRLYPRAVPSLIELLHDQTAMSRTYAAELLGSIGGQPAADALRRTAAADPDQLVRNSAAAALRNLEADTDSAT